MYARIIVKDFGEMKVKLDENIKITTDNFINICSRGLYKNSSFHRIISGFMIQGGKVNVPLKPIKGEFKSNGFDNPILHKRGVISMARTMVKDSATSQFFICHKDAPHLDSDYAAFGYMVSGFEVLDKIANVETDYYDAPIKEVIIENIILEENL